MKLCISTLGCSDWSLDKIIHSFKEVGVVGIEIRGIGGVMRCEEIESLKAENIDDTKNILKQNGIFPVCIGTSCSFDKKENHKTAMDEGKKAVDIAQRLGSPYIRVFGNNISVDAPNISKKNIVDGISQLCKYADDKNITVCLEVHGDVNTYETLSYVIDGLKMHKSFGIIWDICHTYTPYEYDIDEVYKLIFPYIKHIHIKDGIRRLNENGVYKTELCSIGDGKINIAEIVNRLIADGYDGYFSLEHEKKWNPSLSDAETEFPRYVKYMCELNERLLKAEIQF